VKHAEIWDIGLSEQEKGFNGGLESFARKITQRQKLWSSAGNEKATISNLTIFL
jgi:hypothetical protein